MEGISLHEHNGIKYFKSPNGTYKYILDKAHGIYVDIHPSELVHISGFVTLNRDGKLLIHKGYSWDGPSGPAIHTQNFIRGSLVHDALYQLMREGHVNRGFREAADDTLHDICRFDGMSKFRAWYVWVSVRMFGERHTYARN